MSGSGVSEKGTAGGASERHRIMAEPSPRRVRVEFAGSIIADARRPLLLLETGHRPVYYFPIGDVRSDCLVESPLRTRCPYKGEARYWHLRIGDRTSDDAVWAYPEPLSGCADLAQHVAFYWDRVDRWFEEDEEIIAHPRDPYHRVDVVPSHRPVEVALGGVTLGRSTNALFLFETGMPVRYYLPKQDVRMDLLTAASTQSQCPYKGRARYWSARVDGREIADIAWSYEDPLPECPRIKGLISFYNEKVDRLTVEGMDAGRS